MHADGPGMFHSGLFSRAAEHGFELLEALETDLLSSPKNWGIDNEPTKIGVPADPMHQNLVLPRETKTAGQNVHQNLDDPENGVPIDPITQILVDDPVEVMNGRKVRRAVLYRCR
jgi:hypothetical protein